MDRYQKYRRNKMEKQKHAIECEKQSVIDEILDPATKVRMTMTSLTKTVLDHGNDDFKRGVLFAVKAISETLDKTKTS